MPDDFEDDDFEDDGDGDPQWEREARATIRQALETAEFDEEVGCIYAEVGMDHRLDPVRSSFTSADELRDALVELGDSELSAYAPREDGEFVFELDASDIVDAEMSSAGIYDFFETSSVAPDKKKLIADLDDLIKAPEVFRLDVAAVTDELIRYLARHPEKMHELTPRKFEELVAELFKGMGYDIELTQQSRDGGRDILAVQKNGVGSMLTLVECKRYSITNKVDVGIVRSLFGVVEAERANQGVIATTSFFTKDAKDFVDTRDLNYRMLLRDQDHLLQWLSDHKKYGP